MITKGVRSRRGLILVHKKTREVWGARDEVSACGLTQDELARRFIMSSFWKEVSCLNCLRCKKTLISRKDLRERAFGELILGRN